MEETNLIRFQISLRIKSIGKVVSGICRNLKGVWSALMGLKLKIKVLLRKITNRKTTQFNLKRSKKISIQPKIIKRHGNHSVVVLKPTRVNLVAGTSTKSPKMKNQGISGLTL